MAIIYRFSSFGAICVVAMAKSKLQVANVRASGGVPDETLLVYPH